jgi:DNA-binding NtrC family response regulator
MNELRKKVLAADDDSKILWEIDAEICSKYILLKYDRGDDALSKITVDGASIDMVVLDAQMPGMHGEAVAMETRSMHPKMPIVLYTSDDPRIYRHLEERNITVMCKREHTVKELCDYIDKALMNGSSRG